MQGLDAAAGPEVEHTVGGCAHDGARQRHRGAADAEDVVVAQRSAAHHRVLIGDDEEVVSAVAVGADVERRTQRAALGHVEHTIGHHCVDPGRGERGLDRVARFLGAEQEQAHQCCEALPMRWHLARGVQGRPPDPAQQRGVGLLPEQFGHAVDRVTGRPEVGADRIDDRAVDLAAQNSPACSASGSAGSISSGPLLRMLLTSLDTSRTPMRSRSP